MLVAVEGDDLVHPWLQPPEAGVRLQHFYNLLGLGGDIMCLGLG